MLVRLPCTRVYNESLPPAIEQPRPCAKLPYVPGGIVKLLALTGRNYTRTARGSTGLYPGPPAGVPIRAHDAAGSCRCYRGFRSYLELR